MRELKISIRPTNHSPDMNYYFSVINKIPLLESEEEVYLAKRIKQMDEKALEKLVNSNLRFVVSVAKQYQESGIELKDLISEGNYGLVKAAKRFDETKGFKFLSYAVWWIRQSILKYIDENSRMVRLPVNKLVQMNRIRKKVCLLEQECEREITENEFSDFVNYKRKCNVGELLNLKSKKPVPLDFSLNENNENGLLDVLKDNNIRDTDYEISHQKSLEEDMRECLDKFLNERDSKIIKMFYGIGMKKEHDLKEIVAEVGLTKSAIMHVRRKAILKLKEAKPFLREYL